MYELIKSANDRRFVALETSPVVLAKYDSCRSYDRYGEVCLIDGKDHFDLKTVRSYFDDEITELD